MALDHPTKRYRLVVFDFDGTLCDSADVKTEAFYRLYLDERGAHFAGTVRDHHLENIDASRFEKIRYVEDTMIGVTPSEERLDLVADRFSRLVEDAVVAAPLFDGVLDYLTSGHTGVPLAIASATPTAELRRIVDRKGLSGHFEAIEGSPRSKSEILAAFVHDFGIAPDQALMVGDQPSDSLGAQRAGVDALLIAPKTDWTAPFARVNTFREAARWLSNT